MREVSSEDVGEFIRVHGVACGGNWAAMAMHALKNGAPEVWENLHDRIYTFGEITHIIREYLESLGTLC